MTNSIFSTEQFSYSSWYDEIASTSATNTQALGYAPPPNPEPSVENPKFTVDQRVKVLKVHDGNRQAVGKIGIVKQVSKPLNMYYYTVRLERDGSNYTWIFPEEKLGPAVYEDGIDNWV